ncbi:hypothetical protein [Streptococcus oralis]|uniref:Phage protein n=1 Tax=Streptococcus oralis TaxID=1303 RepID=A0AAW7WAR5_STROR|nr:hypothetical protein [Streptococcus oralis]MDO6344651.1 hypothetical protein [Streptococcus oralis]MDO6348584.1 hypothetical protein [Streptococcus oralis]MDO6350568.1 hypothetical protein [Streptococcus oralis]
MNKRQRKKMYTRAFSKAYDESLKWQKGKEQVSITTVKNRQGKGFIITSLTTQVEIMKHFNQEHMEEITIEGYTLDNKKLGLI